MKLIKKNLLLIIVIVIGIASRLSQFSFVPNSLNRDELALGYNAFALANEGQDEWGQSWPITFKSFGDYKLPGYIYLLIPFIKIFGSSDFIVRLPSLLAGIINIWLVYLITRKIFSQPELTPLFSALMLVLMPWAIHYSRVAFEAHVSLTFTLATIYFLIAAQKSPHFLLLAPVTLAFALFTYNSPLLLFPLILLSFVICFRSSFKKNISLFITSFVLFSMVMTVAFALLFSVTQAKTGVTIFTDPTLGYIQRETRIALKDSSRLLAKLIGNRYVFYSKIILQNYFRTFSPKFLIFQGGQHPWHSIPHWAHFTHIQYGLFFFGIILIGLKYRHSLSLWFLFLLFISPLPAAITVDAPHTTRSLLFLSLASIPMALALSWIYQNLPSFKYLVFLLLFIAFIETGLFFKDYIFTFPVNHSPSWKVGQKQAILQTNTYPSDLPIYITDYQSSPYIYVLFYQQLLPSQYLSTIQYYPPDSANLIHVRSFGRYHFVSDKSEIPPHSLLLSPDQSGKITLNQL